ncbi:calcium binding protein [Anaeramoeba ignava]|uniref:Calcium binding protein n=1 Tax=Anaeramoeba ignava TaxID=1746090 RepID=A0A9Q0LM35_ANAIG|nr:calcium binding protein [Anaeramoeba ignava]|eukprot:Anaeramoba_ignava/a218726_512.p1 GENE.a218726_512~~a218726_512.p1  ORF type:complete len:230 (-),score=76.80 a218726_512:152-805(-)
MPPKKQQSFGKQQIKALRARVKKLKGGKPEKCHLTVHDFQLLFNLDQQGAELLHKLFDEDGNGTVEFSELISAFTILSDDSDEKKAEFLFKTWDADGNGVLDKDEVYQMVYSTVTVTAALIAAEYTQEMGKLIGVKVDTQSVEFKQKLQKDISANIKHEDIQKIVDDLFEEVDKNKDGQISLDEFVTHCKGTGNTLAPFVESIKTVIKPQKGGCSIF